MKWRGVTPAQYEAARKQVNWKDDVPAGAVFHVAWFEPDGIRVCDIWKSAEHFQRFVDIRLMPGVQEVGIQGRPEVQRWPGPV
jgi:hypothetical protein